MLTKIKDRELEIKNKIAQSLNIDLDQMVFDYHQMPDYVDLDLFTINKVHKQQFFFHSSEESRNARLTFKSFSIQDELFAKPRSKTCYLELYFIEIKILSSYFFVTKRRFIVTLDLYFHQA